MQRVRRGVAHMVKSVRRDRVFFWLLILFITFSSCIVMRARLASSALVQTPFRLGRME